MVPGYQREHVYCGKQARLHPQEEVRGLANDLLKITIISVHSYLIVVLCRLIFHPSTHIYPLLVYFSLHLISLLGESKKIGSGILVMGGLLSFSSRLFALPLFLSFTIPSLMTC